MPSGTWVLAFDDSCSRCRGVADQVKQAAGDRLEVVPLSHRDVQAWRTEVFGGDAPHAPTLIKTEGGKAAGAWTGVALAWRLAVRLGPRATLSVLKALGALRKGVAAPEVPQGEDGRGGIGRAQFLRLGGLGAAAVALGITASPAAAATRTATPARRWVQANRANLPGNYASFIRFDMDHRKAIYEELAASTRSRLWVDHLRRYREVRPDLTADQRRVLDRAADVADQESTFADDVDAELHRQLDRLEQEAVAVLGADETRVALETLGPPAIAPAASCDCQCPSRVCNQCICIVCSQPGGCTCTSYGCGLFWASPCNGTC